MGATQTSKNTAATDPAEERMLRKSRSILIGEFSDELGVRHQCRLARSRRAGEGLLYVTGPMGPPRCLGLLGGEGADLQREAQSLFADYRASEAESRRCRAVSSEEARELARSGGRRLRAVDGEPEIAAKEDQPTHFDGPGIYEWLIAARVITVGAIAPEHGEAKARRINGWKNGGNASVQLVDELLTRKGHHLGEIPTELRRSTTRPCNRGPRVSPELRKSAIRRFGAGEEARALASELGVTDHSIRNWARKATAAAATSAAA